MIPKRIVLDTNVCLDLFVFNDPRWQILLDAMRQGKVHPVTRADCRKEWQLVLGYAHLGLDEAARQRCSDQFDVLIECLPQRSISPPVVPDFLTDAAIPRLPTCRDPDDQKFLEVARDAGASFLITKDKALLKCAGKTRRAGLFQILQPQDWQKIMMADEAAQIVAY